MTSNYFYLATTYTRHPDGHETAFIEAAKVAADLMKRGINVFCPVAHSHPIACHGNLDAADHDFWMNSDRPFMDGACGIIVCRMPGWRESRGITEEIAVFRAAGKPVLYVDP